MNRDLNSDSGNQNSPKLKKANSANSPAQDNKPNEFKINSNKAIGQRPRSAGFRSFLSWFKKVENLQRHEEEEPTDSSSESSEENSSSSSTATVASFAFLPANKYKPYGEASQPEKFFSPGPYTETYHKLILERNKRRHLDKNISLRKKYSLYSSGTINSKIDRSENVSKNEESVPTSVMYDTFSLPTFSKLKIDSLNEFNDRKTASLSSRNVKTGTHVKGKRKAPLPPISPEYIKSYRKKRKAPPPPLIMPQINDVELTNKKNSSPLTKSPLKERKSVEEKGKKLSQVQNADVSHTNAEISPKPWYKRESKVKHNKNSVQDIAKKKKHEFPEVSFFRCSQLFENFRNASNDKSESENKNEKRVSRLLPNISELDREAAEIIKHHKSNMENEENDILMWNSDVVSKPSSARELIFKFNALSNNAQGNSKVANNIEIKLSNNNIIRSDVLKATSNQNIVENGPTNIVKENNVSNVPSQNLPHEGEISKSFKAEIFSALPDLATVAHNTKKDPIENNIQSKSTELTQKKLTEMEEKIRLRELLKEMKNSLPKRPKTNIIIKENLDKEQDNKTEKSNDQIAKEIISSASASSSQNSTESADKRANFFNNHLQVISQKSNDKVKGLNQSGAIATKAPEKISFVPKKEVKIGELYKPIALAEFPNLSVAKVQNKEPIYNSSKVSSFAQTKSVLCKSEQIYDTTEKIAANANQQPISITALYMNVEESKLPKINPPTDKKLTPSNSSNTTNVLLKQLEHAITEGDDVAAAKLAKDLAMLKVNCLVMCSPDSKEVKWKRINIYIEDQFSHQGPLPIQIPETMTMGELKSKVCKEFNIPIAAQRWIIGKQLADDDNAPLTQYNKNDFETTLFLYVIALEKPLTEQAANKVIEKSDIPSSSKYDPPNVAALNVEKVENVATKNVTTELSVTKACTALTCIIKDVINVKLEEEPKPSNSSNGNPELKNVIKNTWICSECTLINSLLSPLCSACGTRKPSNAEKYKNSKIPTKVKVEDSANHYMQLLNLDNTDLILNMDDFECPICLTNYGPRVGVTLRECLHTFCKQCLENMIKYNEDAELKCPFRDENYSCDSIMQEREIKAIGGKILYETHLAKSIRFAENKIQNTFHCKSPDCKGWCILDDNVNEFICPVCRKNNCLTCQSIHEGKNCKEYQEQMNISNSASKNEGQQTKQMLDDMVKKGEALACPSCQVILMKKWGCDWLRCSMCKTEICWVTRGPRWGPAGKGDTSGGCQCGVNGVKCHPKCNYCH